MLKNDNKNSYKVGYKKPPKSGQFKKGQSGNKLGKRKGNKNFRTDFMEELQTKIEITEGDNKIKTTKQRAMVKRLINSSLSGDAKSTNLTVQLLLDYGNDDEAKNNSKPLTKSELKILQEHLVKQKEADVYDL